jgi:YbbR domain-containing protein
VLNTLKPSDLRVKVDLTGFGVGTNQIIPVVDLLPPRVQVVSILPATVEVVIVEAPTPTPTPTPVPTPTITPTLKP